jgi:hypothetical protein
VMRRSPVMINRKLLTVNNIDQLKAILILFRYILYIPCNMSYDLYKECNWIQVNITPEGQKPDNNPTQNESLTFPSLKGRCIIPSPFIMSQHRCTCVMHQKEFFRYLTLSKQLLQDPVPRSILKDQQSKLTHVNQLFHDWRSHKTKCTVYTLTV